MTKKPSTLDRVGVFVFPWGKRPSTVQSLVDMARHAEARGFDSVRIAWHFTLPPERFNWGNESLIDPLVVLPALVAGTDRVRIALNSAILPLLHPFVWAKYLASLDVMSGGRTIPGLAVGWWAPDFQIGLADMKQRGKRFDEGLEIVTKLWKGEEITQPGQFWDATGLRVEPLPSPHMPLWIGGNEKSIDRAGRWAQGLNPLNPSLDDIRNLYRPGLDAAAEKYGRPRLTLALFNYCVVLDKEDKPAWIHDHIEPLMRQRLYGKDPDESIVYGTPEQCAENLTKLFQAGADYVVFDSNFHGWESEEFGKEQMDRFVEQVLPLIDGKVGAIR